VSDKEDEVSCNAKIPCTACGLPRPKGGWRCPNCQTAHGWHALVDFTIPTLSLLVAFVALLPTVPLIKAYFWPSKAEVYVNAKYVDGRGELLFTFVNIGEGDAIISEFFECEYATSKDVRFFARAPVVVPAKTSASREYEVEYVRWNERTIDSIISSPAAKHEFFRTSRINTECIFVDETDSGLTYYDFGQTEFFLGFNILHNVPFSDAVDFRFDVQEAPTGRTASIQN